MIFIDANIFLAYDNFDDIHHIAAVNLWKKIETGKFEQYFTSDYIFNEVIGVTLRKFGKERAILLGEAILKSVFIINVDKHMLTETWKIFTKTKLSLNLVDCTNLVIAKLADAKFIATFDKEFKKIDWIKVLDN